jgi:putative transposase
MARIARIVVPDVAHHVTQRGNRRQEVFFSDADYQAYRDLVAAACAAHEVRCLAWCLMPNHVHLILVPKSPDGLRAALADSHRRYSRRINIAHGWTGYLWQGRFASYPMDDAHLLTAIRYVELNPVRAGLVKEAGDWPWSSARAHLTGRSDGLTDLAALAGQYRNWRAMLRDGLEAGDLDESVRAEIESSARTGRPRGDEKFVAAIEERTGRALRRQKRGPKPKLKPAN